MRLNHQINVFLINDKWLDKNFFNTKKKIDKFIYMLSAATLKRFFSISKYKNSKKLETNINFILADYKFLKKLNTNFLNKKKATNVLSFSNDNFSKNKDNFLGEVFLSYETCLKEAIKFKIPNKDRVGHLIVHGILHLLGYDHKTKIEEKKMEDIASKILNSLNINYN